MAFAFGSGLQSRGNEDEQLSYGNSGKSISKAGNLIQYSRVPL